MFHNSNTSDIILQDTAPLLSVLYICVLFIVVFVSLTTNIVVCTTIFSSSGLRSPLDFYILNLAVGDILSSFFATFTVDNVQLEWSLGTGVCKFIYYMNFVCFSVTVVLLCLMCAERYYGICKPLKPPKENVFRRYNISIPITWLVSVLIFIPFLLACDVEQIQTTSGTKQMCSETWGSDSKRYYALFVLLAFLVAPGGLMAFLFARIILKLNTPRTSTSGGSVVLHKKRKAESKLLLVLVLLQFTCWTPIIILKLIHHFEATGTNYLKMWLFLELVHFSRPFMYPLVYYLMYPVFRNNLKALFKSCFPSPARSKNSTNGSISKEPPGSSAPSETSMKFSSPPEYNFQFSGNGLSTAM